MLALTIVIAISTNAQNVSRRTESNDCGKKKNALPNGGYAAHSQNVAFDRTKLALHVPCVSGNGTCGVMFKDADGTLARDTADARVRGRREVDCFIWTVVAGQHIAHSRTLSFQLNVLFPTGVTSSSKNTYHAEEPVEPSCRGLHGVITSCKYACHWHLSRHTQYAISYRTARVRPVAQSTQTVRIHKSHKLVSRTS